VEKVSSAIGFYVPQELRISLTMNTHPITQNSQGCGNETQGQDVTCKSYAHLGNEVQKLEAVIGRIN
jgi:hypothetical protein